jgi:putative transposase
MCRIFNVSRSGYYRFIKQKKFNNKNKEKAMIEEVIKIHKTSRGSYGTRRVSESLKQNQYSVGRYKARTLMKKAGVSYQKKKKFIKTTDSKHQLPTAPNILNRNFTVLHPNRVWVSDISYLRTKEGWLYLAVILDLYSRKIVGWSMQKRITADLVEEALNLAVQYRKPSKGLILHSDRGTQYASNSYQKLLKDNNITCSMSRKGNCWDNAVMERFFASLKTEWIKDKVYTTHSEARLEVVKYINLFYNTKRLHSTLKYQSPVQFEKKFNVS